jgi:hypothetical protein
MANGPKEIRIPPQQPLVSLKALTVLVRVPGRPEATRAFTANEADNARHYTAEQGGTREQLPTLEPLWDWENGRWIGPR